MRGGGGDCVSVFVGGAGGGAFFSRRPLDYVDTEGGSEEGRQGR